MVLFVLLISISDLSHALYGAKPLTASLPFSSVVTLDLNDPNQDEHNAFCSGVLVSPDTILTTGHCMDVMGMAVYDSWNIFEYEPNLIRVNANGKKYEVADVIISPSYTEGTGFDVEDLAMIKLKKPITTIKPMRLVNKTVLKAGLKVSMVARGKIADSTITSVKNYSGNTVIFADGAKSGVCQGDSGGALLVKTTDGYFLAGILSAQSEGCIKQTVISNFARILNK